MAQPGSRHCGLDSSSLPLFYTTFLVYERGKLGVWSGKYQCFPLLALSTYSVNIALLWLFKVPKLFFLRVEDKITRLIA